MDHLSELAKKAVEDPSKTWAIAKTAAEVTKNLFTFSKSLKDRDEKHQVDEILETLRDLQQSAGELEQENRELREKLRFKSNDYEFRNPFWYRKDRPETPLCAKCFAKKIEAPMGLPGHNRTSPGYRPCLVCEDFVWLGPSPAS